MSLLISREGFGAGLTPGCGAQIPEKRFGSRRSVGAPSWQVFLALVWLFLARSAGASDIDVTVEYGTERATEVSMSVQLLAVPTDSSKQSSDTISWPVNVPGSIQVTLPNGRAWRLAIDVPAIWSTEAVVYSTSEDLSVLLEVYPSVELAGNLISAGHEALPDDLEIRFRPAGGNGGAAGVVGCPIKVDGGWNCFVAAGMHDLELRVDGFAPTYLWHVDLSSPLDLGTIHAVAGASISGYCRLEEGSEADRGCQVELKRSLPHSASGAAAASRESHAAKHTVRTDRLGFFQFRAVPVGTYLLTGSAVGFAAAERGPVNVSSRTELRLAEPLIVRKPIEIRVSVDPPVDPFGHSWEILFSRLGTTSPPLTGRLSEAGEWRRAGISPGRFQVSVVSSPSDKWWTQDVALDRDRRELAIELPLVLIHGTVRLGDEPVMARIWFGGRSGQRRITVDSDDEGRFSGYLPEAGKWPLEVAIPVIRQRLELAPVEIALDPYGQEALVDIEIENGSIAGWVMSEDGSPAAGAEVEADVRLSIEEVFDLREAVGLTRSGLRLRGEADSDGRFELHGLPAGEVRVRARATGAESDTSRLMLESGARVPDLRLVLREKKTLLGVVISEAGPVAGAFVNATLWDASLSTGLVTTMVTDSKGRFHLSVSATTAEITVIVAAAGFATRILRALPDQDLTLTLDRPAGRLTLSAEGGSWFSSVVLFHNGAQTSPLGLRPTFAASGWEWDPRIVVIPNAESGDYALCPSRLQLRTPLQSYCATGYLPAGG